MPRALPTPELPPLSAVLAGGDVSCAVTQGGALMCWSSREDAKPAAIELPGIEPHVALGVDGSRLCTVDEAGALRCWALAELERSRVQGALVQAPLVAGIERLVLGAALCWLRADGVAGCRDRSHWNVDRDDPDDVPEAVVGTRGLRDLVSRHGWGCALEQGGEVQCWADGQRAWRLRGAPTLQTVVERYTLQLDCPADSRARIEAEAHVCLDAAGRRQGPARLFWPDGRLRARGAFADDLRSAEWVEHDEAGQGWATGRYVAGERDGRWRHARRDWRTGDEVVLVEGQWARSVAVGEWRFDGGANALRFSDEGEPVAWSLASGTGAWRLQRDDAGQWWREDLGVDGVLRGRAQISEPAFRPVWTAERAGAPPGDYRFTGTFEALDEAGVRISGTFVEGRASGAWRGVYDASGQEAWRVTFVDGEPHGRWQAWHGNGVPALDGVFEAGVPVGRWQRWHAGGQLAADGQYAQGMMVGTWRWTSEDGQQVYERHFVEPEAGLVGVLSAIRSDSVFESQRTPCARSGIHDAFTSVACEPPPTPTLLGEVADVLDLEPRLDMQRVEGQAD